jgi:prophage regulatory protein
MLLRIQTVKSETGDKSNATIYNNIRDGLFTKSVQIGKRAVGWPAHEVKAICAARIAGKQTEEIKQLVNYLHEQRSRQLDHILSSMKEVQS